MNHILLWKIIPFIGAIIHTATSGWLTWSGSIDIFTFIKEPLTITWGIQTIELSLDAITVEMSPSQFISTLEDHTSLEIRDSTLPLYYFLLVSHYLVLLSDGLFFISGIIHKSRSDYGRGTLTFGGGSSSTTSSAPPTATATGTSNSRTIFRTLSNGHNLSQIPSPSRSFLFPTTSLQIEEYHQQQQQQKTYNSQRLYLNNYKIPLLQSIKVMYHLIYIIFLFTNMDQQELCVSDETKNFLLSLELSRCDYGWQSITYPFLLCFDIFLTWMIYSSSKPYVLPKAFRKRSRSTSEDHLLEIKIPPESKSPRAME